MKKEVMKKWVKALRSGKYSKGTLKLYNKETDCYCVLGVLCEISGLGKFNWNGSYYITDGESSSLLSDYIIKYAGLQNGNPILTKAYKVDGYKFHRLYQLNDYGLSFKQIANIIEKNYKDL